MQTRLTPGFISTAAKPPAGKDRIIYWDERLSTAAVTRSLIEQNAQRALALAADS